MIRWCSGTAALVAVALSALSGCGKDKCEPCAQDSECQSGLVCHPEAKVCRPPGDKPACQAECEKSERCAKFATCTLKGDKCVVGELDCSKSAQCTDEGKCTRKDLGDIGTCITINEADCQKSTSCQTKGHCSVDRKSRLCRALADSDCEASEMCKQHKKCKADKATGECVAGES